MQQVKHHCRHPPPRWLVWWLALCAALIVAMILLGGTTRLTGSGLSIVEWRPISGVLPPLSHADWSALFEAYRRTPEFRERNFWMSLDDFRGIFWLEYAHRLLGRAIGVVFALPLAYLLLARRIHRALAGQLLVVLGLGALQGGLGWLMVRSGLGDRPDVSHYRLAAHLGLALVIYAWIVTLIVGIAWPKAVADSGRAGGHATILVGLVFLAALSGALVAGLDAGFAYNSFPLMDGRLVPNDLFALHPWLSNFGENPITAQFQHRVLALICLVAGLALWWRGRGRGQVALRYALAALLAAVVLQVVLGIATLVLSVPIPIAVAHQAGAVGLLTAALIVRHLLTGDVVQAPRLDSRGTELGLHNRAE